MPQISSRGKNISLSPFRKLISFSDKAKKEGKKVYHLNIGQPDIETPAAAMQAVKDTDLKILAYTQAIGNESYRKKLVKYYRQYGLWLKPSEMIVTTGASEAILFLFLSCLSPGDEVIIPEPFYANYNGFAQMAGVVIKPITCTIENGFALPSIADFEAAISEKTKAIFITNPNNPTGCLYAEDVLVELSQLVNVYDLFLFVDEVYREFCYDGGQFFSILNIEEISENVVVVDSISKRYSACGARIGTIVSRNVDVINSITKYAKLRLSPPGLAQIFAEATLDMDGQYLEEVVKEYDRRRILVFNRLKAMKGVVNYKPGGAFYAFAKLPIDDGDRFCQWLLEDFDYNGATLMLAPGTGFYATANLGKQEVRIAYVLNTDDLNKAMDCLENALLVYPGRLVAEEVKTKTA
ncbi:MAG TPA: pyridoxal phosphate-dependent aminotransferase [Bacteroidetes bacterium]|nr:pyridoxal phosphate-dependent aminotransferase [Bacteroidota bacterium]